MKKDTLVKLTKNFEESAHAEAGIEYWMAREFKHCSSMKNGEISVRLRKQKLLAKILDALLMTIC